MLTTKDTGIEPVRVVEAPAFIIAGLGERYTVQAKQGIPALWQRFAKDIDTVPGRIGKETYGLCCNPDQKGGFEYIAGVEVGSISQLPEQYRWFKLAGQRYAVFEHHGQVEKIGHTFEKIWKHWYPASGEQAADAPEFERYGGDFDPQSKCGRVEIWVPLMPK
ncbi:AraC family transcriptional regulator [Pseudomonas sp. SDI]|uniref:GyrI-like domain-containing protein n=1 Tax=Pseudomonas sp. SDI TaxID=2170734 RepID=UPI000DE770BF|nr:GyrI-like domain-containing protein [Pseudomonas sp. SDI]PWB32801.1 AraC family transcriptional regulator [Pseudomonas sp. SDI]